MAEDHGPGGRERRSALRQGSLRLRSGSTTGQDDRLLNSWDGPRGGLSLDPEPAEGRIAECGLRIGRRETSDGMNRMDWMFLLTTLSVVVVVSPALLSPYSCSPALGESPVSPQLSFLIAFLTTTKTLLFTGFPASRGGTHFGDEYHGVRDTYFA